MGATATPGPGTLLARRASAHHNPVVDVVLHTSPWVCKCYGVTEEQSDAVGLSAFGLGFGSAITGAVMVASQSSNSSTLYWFLARLHPRWVICTLSLQ